LTNVFTFTFLHYNVVVGLSSCPSIQSYCDQLRSVLCERQIAFSRQTGNKRKRN